MSIRYFYRRPSSQRICSYHACLQVIERNIDEDDEGNLYHHGCLMNAKDEHWQCLNCFAKFDGRKIVLVDFGDGPAKACGYCGSQNIQPLPQVTHTWQIEDLSFLSDREGLAGAAKVANGQR